MGALPSAFVAGLVARLARAVGPVELDEATRPPSGEGVVRRVEPDTLWIGSRRVPSTIPRIELALDPPVDARVLSDAWGLERPIAIAVDAHQASWRIALAGAGLPDPHGRRVAADPVLAGAWELRAVLDGRPPGPLPSLAAGASPAYDVRERGGEVVRIEVVAGPRRIDLVDGGHPDARALLGGMAAFYPAWRVGWNVAPDTPFVVVYDGDRPAAGAAIAGDGPGTTAASRICVSPDRVAGLIGSALLDAIEAVALERGCRRVTLDGSAFLATSEIPYLRHGYVVAPPYDGEADEGVWAERELRAGGA